MNVEQYTKLLLDRIPSAKIASGGREVNCRCMYCGDSKNPRSRHFYISIPQDDKTPSIYYCHLCHNSGVMSYQKLIEWDIYEDGVAMDLINHNKNCSKYGTNNKFYTSVHYNVVYRTTTDNEITRIKLKYINDRIGYNFSYEELMKLKIVLNLGDILRDNYITQLTRGPQIVDQLDKNFLGFLSIDNAFLNMRRICDKGLVYSSIDKRYINYKLYDKFDTSERFYTVPTQIDVSRPERIKIHIAEGPFDILSIYKNVRHEEPGIYSCIGGSNYMGMAMYFLERYKISFCEYHYYPDNDEHGSNYMMKKIAQYLRPMNIPLYVHRNLSPGQKDFGVPLDQIQESIMLVDPY